MREQTNKSIVLVGGLGRTGGSLVPFFLDGNPGMVSLPFEMHLSNTIGFNVTDTFLQAADQTEILRTIVKPQLFNNATALSSDKSRQKYV